MMFNIVVAIRRGGELAATGAGWPFRAPTL
jgi:hypothetical protein